MSIIKYKNKDWLKEQYINQKKSSYQISESCNCDSSTVRNWLKKFNIPIRESRFQKGNIINKGRTPWNKGKEALYCKGENHYNWKGTNATYKVIHLYIQKRKEKPTLCEKCNTKKKLELSFDHSLGKCTRNIQDYKYLCHSCHMKRDWNEFKIMNNQFTIKKKRRKK